MSLPLQRPNQPSIRVVCLGLSRTGTTSMNKALEILGYGPCYHTFSLISSGVNDLPKWMEIYDKGEDLQIIDSILQGYSSVLDLPAVNFPEALYRAYPNAKFILTTRDPAKWEQSIKQTLVPRMEKARNAKEPTESMKSATAWWDQYVKQYPELHTESFQSVLLRHNERVQNLIPASELLVYNVEEGWEPLAELLGVAIPEVPFPHVNDTQSYRMDRDLPSLQ
ncbi:hypothetical protein M422DRAFT_264377 [Sphaerobolus stellatus SS14]|uniref:Protein-tyrosine sulfotransferase n=1 Tax=Sphaerobolus stellatus (strain SS14) TaxID=990650 RepID=A0A0C9V846_SPHS4|nr:hypothetical protein M422DRAFT_264377 [Sphaerobolus stellatus SS14]